MKTVIVVAVVATLIAGVIARPGPGNSTGRLGPCPGLALDSCECFAILYNQSLRVQGMTDIVARNWWITLSYQDIGQSLEILMQRRFNKDLKYPLVGVWPNIAVFASNEVGYGIRQQALNEELAWWSKSLSKADQADAQALALLGNELFAFVFKKTAHGLAGGNEIVFQEIGLSYSRYGLEFCAQKTRDDAKMQRFIDRYVCRDNCTLAKSFWAMYHAHFDDGLTFAQRDELLLVQGMLTGLQEQTRLDPYLNASLPGYDFCTPSGKCFAPRLLNEFATWFMIQLTVGNHRMQTTSNLPSDVWGAGHNFGPYLTPLAPNSQARTILQQLEYDVPDIDKMDGTAAQDWNSLAQRMKFVAPMFRVFQDHASINCYVWTPEVEAAVRANNTRSLDPHSWTRMAWHDLCQYNGRFVPPQ